MVTLVEPQPVEPHGSDAWIAPNGAFYGVDTYGHSRFADTYLRAKGESEEVAWRGVSHLENLGWIHLTGGWIVKGARATLTSRQADTLFATLAAYRNSQYRNLDVFESEIRRILSEGE